MSDKGKVKRMMREILLAIDTSDEKSMMDVSWMVFLSSHYGEIDPCSEHYAHLYVAYTTGMMNMFAYMDVATGQLSQEEFRRLMQKMHTEMVESHELVEAVKEKFKRVG